MNTNAISQIADSLNKLAAQFVSFLGPSTKQIWAMFVRQSFLYGVTDIIGAVLLLAPLIGGITLLRYTLKMPRDHYGMMVDGAIFGTIASCFAIATTLILIPCLLVNGIYRLENPSFFAIRDALNVLSGGGH